MHFQKVQLFITTQGEMFTTLWNTLLYNGYDLDDNDLADTSYFAKDRQEYSNNHYIL